MAQTLVRLHVGLAADALTVNPAVQSEDSGPAVVDQLYEHVLGVRADATYTARELGSGWSVLDSGHAVQVDLTAAATFHDGSEVTADDVAASLSAVVQVGPGSRVGMPSGFKPIQFEVRHRHQLRVHLPDASLDHLAALARARVLPRRLVDAGPELLDDPTRCPPIGSGAFRFSSWKPEQLTLQANERYRGGRPVIDEVAFCALGSIEAAVDALCADRVDYVPGIPAAIALQLEACSDLQVRWSEPESAVCLAFNLAQSPLHDATLRQSIAHSIDRQALVHSVLNGAAVVADTLGPVSATWRNSDLMPYEYDLRTARALLEHADCSRAPRPAGSRERDVEPLDLTILVDDQDPALRAVAEWITEDLARIEIGATVHPLPTAALEHRLEQREFQAAVVSLSTSTDPGLLRQLYHSDGSGAPGSGDNALGYRNDAVDHALDSLSVNQSPDVRRAQLAAVQRLVHTDVPHVVLYRPLDARAAMPGLVLPDVHRQADELSLLRHWELEGRRALPLRRSPDPR